MGYELQMLQIDQQYNRIKISKLVLEWLDS